MNLAPFRKRIRLVRAWRGLGVGLLLAGAAGLVWAALDWSGQALMSWPGLGLLAFAGAGLGAAVSALLPIRPADIARSVDRRAGLRDRLTTVQEKPGETVFAQALAADAAGAVAQVQPRTIYPVRFTRWQLAGLIACTLAASVFLLGNSPLIRPALSDSEKAELAEAGAEVERVIRPLLDPEDPTAEERRLAGDISAFGAELKRGRLDPEAAEARAQELAEEAREAAGERAKQAEEQLAQAEDSLRNLRMMELEKAGLGAQEREALELSPEELQAFRELQQTLGQEANAGGQLTREQLEELGLEGVDPNLLNLTQAQRQELLQSIEQMQEEISQQLEAPAELSPEQIAELQRRFEMNEQLQQALELSPEARQAIEELMQSQEFQELQQRFQELQQQMQQATEQVQQGEPLTEEQLQQLQQALDQLSQAIEDPMAREMIMQQLEQAMQELQSGNMSAETAQMLQGLFGAMQGQNSGATGSQSDFPDSGEINLSEEEWELSGDTKSTGVRGEWQEEGDSTSVDIKAPTELGKSSTVPYQNVLPGYEKSAEQAIERGTIPKEHLDRVREYFDSLNKK